MEKKKFSFKIVFNIIFYLIIIGVLLVAITNIVGAKKGKQPTIFGYSTYYIITGSMEPTIPTGSLVIDKAGNNQAIEKGDVVTIKDGNNITTHRVYEILDNGNEFRTKGDANNAIDPVIRNKNDILGVVKFHIPYLGDVASFIKNNIIVVICAIIAIFAAISLLGMITKK